MTKFKNIKLFIALLVCVICINTAYAAPEKQGENKAKLSGRATMIDLVSEKLEYYPELNQFVATGNASISLEDQDSTLTAKKIIYDQEKQVLIAEENVKMTKNGQVVYGDYTRIDLNSESSIIDNPYASIETIRIKAKTANVYSESIEAFNGKAIVDTEDLNFALATTTGSSPGSTARKAAKAAFEKERNPTFDISAKYVEIKSEPKRNIIILKNATVKIKKYKIATIPYFKMTTDKQMHNVETMLPEFGSSQEMGFYIGPSQVFYIPGGATLKTAPLFAMSDSNMGIGGIARFTSSKNKTEIGYTTTKKQFLVSGRQDLFEDTFLIYGGNNYLDNGMFGLAKPRAMVDLVHLKENEFEDMNLNFTTRLSAGYVEAHSGIKDVNDENKIIGVDRRWGTGRFKWQGNVENIDPIWSIKDEMLALGYRGQVDVSIYGNGDVTGIVRAGPSLTYDKGPLWANLTYFSGGTHGEAPFLFDRYNHGKSNLTLYSTYTVSKHVTLGYSGSYNLSKDNWNGKLLAENTLYALVGPGDFKFKFGYDTVRERMVYGVNILVGYGNTDLDFEKLKVINPGTLTKDPNKDKKNSKQVDAI